MDRTEFFRRNAGGFALALVLILLALVLALGIGLALVIRIGDRRADQEICRAIARRHARLALNLATAELQRYAGPDRRLTATSDFANADSHLTGVWDSGHPDSPLTWLISGNQADNPVAVGPGAISTPNVILVGPGSVGTGNATAEVRAPLLDSPEGDSPAPYSGRYAWWIGDEGTKASLAVPDRSGEVNYPPFDSAEARLRLRCQLPRTPTWLSATAPYGFDPLAAENASRLASVILPAQIAGLQFNGPAIPAAWLAAGFHDFTSEHLGVLANTRVDQYRGLKIDLSLAPAALGAAVANWANYLAYMEPPGTAGPIPPIADDSSMRRRYRLVAPISSASAGIPGFQFSVAPVPSEFMLQFSLQRAGNVVQVKARVYVGLWNPYTSALVPEDLKLEVSGLPVVSVSDVDGAGGKSIDLASVFGGTNNPPYRMTLPFVANGTNDTVSWLPGRLYSWTTATGSAPSEVLHFYDKNITATGWTYTTTIPGTAHLAATVPAATLHLKLTRADGTQLAAGTSPPFPAFSVGDTMSPAQDGWNFGFGFRLRQPSSRTTDRSWLVTPGLDPRAADLPAASFAAFDLTKGLDPSQYFGTTTTASGQDHFLVFRSMGGSSNVSLSANNDVPLFELPRQPILNLAEIQHLAVIGARPFSTGNSWAAPAADGTAGNSLFDRFYFSGIDPAATRPDLGADEPLPNFRLVPSPGGSTPIDLATLQSAGSGAGRFLLVAGAFNVNSTRVDAWRAVLGGFRFADSGWTRADIDNSASPSVTLGTQSAGPSNTVTESFPDTVLGLPGFALFRFPQSAQETFAAAPLANPNAPTRVPFRRGVRAGDGSGAVPGFTVTQLDALASAIASRVRTRLQARGPFGSWEEFLATADDWGGRSLLEDAIAASGVNGEAISPTASAPSAADSGFSSLTITQADLLGLLAPVGQTRSDTFVVRAYGECVNRITGNVAARAWCEARVQRFPSPFAAGDDAVQPAGKFGRRFRIVAFRWLTAPGV